MGRKGLELFESVRGVVSLLKQGRNPSPTNLRLELGRGSYTTILKHLRTLALRSGTHIEVEKGHQTKS